MHFTQIGLSGRPFPYLLDIANHYAFISINHNFLNGGERDGNRALTLKMSDNGRLKNSLMCEFFKLRKLTLERVALLYAVRQHSTIN